MKKGRFTEENTACAASDRPYLVMSPFDLTHYQ